MSRHSEYSLPVETRRSYMRALRGLLGFGQYYIVTHTRGNRFLRESEVSVIEGKIGLEEKWPIYANFMRNAIEDSGHSETIKEVMKTLLKEWEEAK